MADREPYTAQIPKPTAGSSARDITRFRRITLPRFREQQPAINQDLADTVPGTGSGDQ
jgi:hypothetical protein